MAKILKFEPKKPTTEELIDRVAKEDGWSPEKTKQFKIKALELKRKLEKNNAPNNA